MLTDPSVRDFWAFMQKTYGSNAEQKSKSVLMNLVADVLGAAEFVNKDEFMKNFVTTLYKTIYIPFAIGEVDTGWSLWNQVRVCVHEHQHIEQGERDGWGVFAARYLTSSSFRAGYEAEAFGSDLEMEFWRTGSILDIDQRVSTLKSYGCSAADIDQAKEMLTRRSDVVKLGIILNQTSQVAIGWLESHVTDLQEVK
jgi:hypothetical protein